MTSTENTDHNNWIAAAAQSLKTSPLPNSTMRLIHNGGNDIRCDRLGQVCWFYWHRTASPTQDTMRCFDEIRRRAGCQHWIARNMNRFSSDPEQRKTWNSPQAPEKWKAQEHDITYLFYTNRGLSPGLFLDQRQNRRWVLSQAEGRKVLNLFAYTGSFGLCASHVGAAEVTHVDTSHRHLEWAAENCRENHLNLSQTEFVCVDARLFLQGCKRRRRLFDLIICDPPSFSRNRKSVFQIERDLPEIIMNSVAVLAPAGQILVSCNYEKWTRFYFETVVSDSLNNYGTSLHTAPKPDGDFELPGKERILKSTIISRPS